MEIRDDQAFIPRIKEFCSKNQIATTNTLAITIQENRTSQYSALIVDFENSKLLPLYPLAELSTYKEKSFGSFLVCYHENLPCLPSMPILSDDVCDPQFFPFCCGEVKEYKPPRSNSMASLFSGFKKHQGHFPNVVFEVKKQNDFGCLIWQKNFQLINNSTQEIQGNFSQKLHSFMNYKCLKHGVFFSIDLFSATEQKGYNYHHMRLNPFSKINTELLNNFFNSVKE